MKKIPLSLVPILLFALFMTCFLFLPKDADLISKSGDYTVGVILGYAFVITLIIDFIRLFKRKKMQVDSSKVENNESLELKKIKKHIKNTGDSIYAVGWITIVGNILMYLWGVFDINYPINILPKSDLTSTILIVAMMFIFIVCGDRIRKLKDIRIKLYLQIVLVLSLALLAFVLFTGGRIGIILLIIIAYVIASLFYLKNAMKMEEFTSTLTNPEYKLNKEGWKIFAVMTIIIIFIAYRFDISHPQIPKPSPDQIVQEVKTSTTFPQKIDEYTTLLDIKAKPHAILYEYSVNNIDPNAISSEMLKSNIYESACGDKNIKDILDQGIDFEYSYSIEGTAQVFFVSFTKNDCLLIK